MAIARRNKHQPPIHLSLSCILTLVLVLLHSGCPRAVGGGENGSDPSVAWSVDKERGNGGAMESLELEEDGDEQLAGGFSTLDSMLQWAIGHSDPAKLKEKAEHTEKLSPEEVLSKQLEIKELMEKLKMPSDADLMKIAIADLSNSSSSSEERLRALNELLVLVEPIDNALDMDKLGGLVAVIKELEDVESEIRTTSAWVLGKASQNNALVQNQILDYGALARLMKMVHSSYSEEAVKAFYAISSLIRNNDRGQELFYLEGGAILLQDMLTNSSIDTRLQKKVVFLVADLADYQANIRSSSDSNNNNPMLSLLSNRVFLESVVDLSVKPDLDLQEKVLMAVRSLLHLTSTEARDLDEFCSLEQALERLRVQLEALISDEDLAEFARDVETLRREVQSLFHHKLEQARRASQ